MNRELGEEILARGDHAVLRDGDFFRLVRNLPGNRFDVIWEGDSALKALRQLERAEPGKKTKIRKR